MKRGIGFSRELLKSLSSVLHRRVLRPESSRNQEYDKKVRETANPSALVVWFSPFAVF